MSHLQGELFEITLNMMSPFIDSIQHDNNVLVICFIDSLYKLIETNFLVLLIGRTPS